MRILGLDPGLRTTGWGVIDCDGSRILHVAHGEVRSTGDDLSLRLLSLHDQLSVIVETYRPDTAAVEITFVNRDGAGSLKLGQARAVALLVPARAGVPVAEYAPNAIKKAVVGVGHADKAQVAYMVGLQLRISGSAGPDAMDALAIALCHAASATTRGRLSAAVARAGR